MHYGYVIQWSIANHIVEGGEGGGLFNLANKIGFVNDTASYMGI